MTQTSLLADLQSTVGTDYARPPDPKSNQFIIDGFAPQAIVHPATYEEVAAVMRFADDRGLAVIPQSEGRITWIGNIPTRYDIALSVSRLNQVIQYEPADLTITCQAGAKFEDGYPPLNSNGQSLPISSVSCVGRSLALPLRGHTHAGDLARDCTIGLRVVTSDGRIIRTGGNVVKNVAGYDLTKLFVGSMGTLGVLVEATFKLLPAPQAKQTFHLEFGSIRDAYAFVPELQRRGLSLSGTRILNSMEITDEGASPLGFWRLGLYLAGSTAAVTRSRAEIETLFPSMGGTNQITEIPKRKGPMPAWTRVGDALTCEASLLPSQVPDVIGAIDAEVPGAFIEGSFAPPNIGFTWLGVGPDEDRVSRVRGIVARFGGSMIVHCDPALKRNIDVFGDVPPKTLELMRRIKREFDPNGILSPGRFVGKL